MTRAVRFLLSFQNRDGGFELTNGRGSDAQSTAWAIQGLVAAGRTPPRSAFAYLARLKRADGSYRYSARYVTTPVWVTSQVLAALAKKPFPFD
jgi:prenyltransferase beta subunit